MDIRCPLKEIDQNNDKTAEHWFDHYSIGINKLGKEKVPLINKDNVNKHELVRFRGIISNQLNSEYFNKLSKFRNAEDFKQPDNYLPNQNDIIQRLPMIIRSPPNQTEWSKSVIYRADNTNVQQTHSIMAKFYCHSNSIKICDHVEVFGIWAPKSKNVQETENEKKNNQETNQDISKKNSYDELDIIHVLYWKKIEWANPLISESAHLNDLDKLFSYYYENASLIRSSLIKLISKQYVSNDHLLAEYILLNLVSQKVSKPKDSILLGHFPLNIRGMRSLNSYKIRELYKMLTPNSLNINLTIQALNAKRFVPVKNNQTDELEMGILQFHKHASVIIDETSLKEGNLEKTGLQNLESLEQLINEQKVFYDFAYFTIPFETCNSMLILSKNGPLPQLRTFCHIYADCESYVLSNDANNNDEEEEAEEEETFTLDQYRTYLSIASYLMDKFALTSKDVCKEIEEDFVEQRKKDKNANENTLHHRLLLMRVINASFLNQTTDDDMMNILKYMQMLEAKRTARNERFEKKVKSTKGTELNSIKEEVEQ